MTENSTRIVEIPYVKLFGDDDVRNQIPLAQRALKQKGASATEQIEINKIEFLHSTLGILVQNHEEIDRNTQINVGFIASSVRGEINRIVDQPTPERVDELYATLYRFIVEFDLSIPNNLSRELNRFMRFAEENIANFSGDARLQIEWARNAMPIAIIKGLLNDPALGRIRDSKEYSASIDAKFSSWEESLKTKSDAVNALKANLDQYESAFNFVGLYDAFRNLGSEKSKELFWLKIYTVVFGILAVIPLVAGAAFAHSSLFKETPLGYITTAVPVFSITLILIYYFRIILRNADSCRSQILQIELRKALCQFIQSYAAYAKSMRKEDASLLDKFENVVFSGIVATDEKMPSTFDGIDQLANLLKSVRAK